MPPTGEIDGKYYEVVDASSLAQRLALRARLRMHEDFLALVRPAADETILDFGVSDVMRDEANMLERTYAHPEAITAVGLGTARAFQETFPRVRYQQIAPHAALPFADKSFAITVSNAVLDMSAAWRTSARWCANCCGSAGAASSLCRIASSPWSTTPASRCCTGRT